MKSKKINAKINNNIYYAEVTHSLEAPWEIYVNIPDKFTFHTDGSDLFEALQKVRKEAAKIGLTFLCNGSRLNVYPSPMMRSMGGAAMAYTLTLGQQAQRKSIVCIFDNTDEPVSTPDEQDSFYQKWLKSL
jgi:hypothetical protein